MAKVINEEEVAGDAVIQFGKKAKGAPTISQQDLEKDSITKAIQEQIILKQIQALQNAIAREIADEEKKSDFQKLNRSELNTYLRTQEGREQALKALDTVMLQNELASLEVKGYKYINENFKDNFKDIEWKPGPTTDSRTNTITDDDGNKICDLTERTIKQDPVTIKLADGTEKTVSSYRSVDFPKQLEGTGPMDIQMAVKDSSGKNIAASKAVYFTAHYNDDGKLQEVSTPMPLKFMGEGKDAIGYIERDGEIYTLPVTKGKYQEMMQEVARNNGMGLDLSRDVETIARTVDKVVTPPTQQKEKQQVENAPLETPEPTVVAQQNKPLETPEPTVVAQPDQGPPNKAVPEIPKTPEAVVTPGKTGVPPPPPGPMVVGSKKGQKQQNAPLETPQPTVVVQQNAAPEQKPVVAPSNIPVPPPMPDKLKPKTNAGQVPPVTSPTPPQPTVVAQPDQGPPNKTVPEIPKTPEAVVTPGKTGVPPPPPGPMVVGSKKGQKQQNKPLETPQPTVVAQPDQPQPTPEKLALDLPKQPAGKGDVLADIAKGGFKLKKITPEQIAAENADKKAAKAKGEEVEPENLAEVLAKALGKNRIAIDKGGDAEVEVFPIQKEAFDALGNIDQEDRVGAMDLLKDAIANGKADFAAALVKLSANPGDEWIYEYNKNDLKEAYNHGMDLAAKQTSVEAAEKIHRAAGSIATAAVIDVKDHAARIDKNNVTIDPSLAKGGMAK